MERDEYDRIMGELVRMSRPKPAVYDPWINFWICAGLLVSFIILLHSSL